MNPRKCIVTNRVNGENVTREAIFHAWGSNFIEFSEGPGNFSSAIIEYPDGQVDNVAVECVKFEEPTKL